MLDVLPGAEPQIRDVRQTGSTTLRHVAQVYAAEAGATLPELMARLGHATPAAALVYLHARSNRDHRLTAALSSAMEPSAPASAIAE